MLIKTFTLRFDPALDGFDDEGLRAFISGKEVKSLRQHFFMKDETPYWAFAVTYDVKPAAGEPPRIELPENTLCASAPLRSNSSSTRPRNERRKAEERQKIYAEAQRKRGEGKGRLRRVWRGVPDRSFPEGDRTVSVAPPDEVHTAGRPKVFFLRLDFR